MRVVHLGLVLALVAGIGCSSDDPELERRGGEIPRPMPEPSEGGAGGGGAGTGGTSDLVPFCDALAVTRAKCQRCHGDPTENGAPVPFVTYDDFQASYFESKKWWQRAQEMVEIDYMPYVALNEPPTNLMPPVEPLTAEEKMTLLTWFQQGALPEGGTDCP
jgi:hypothetical protein